MKSIYNLSESELLEGTSTAPGRVRTFLLNPEKETTPHSCTLYFWGQLPEEDVAFVDCLKFITRALKGGAGVKIVFPRQTLIPKAAGNPLWFFTCSEAHQEYNSLSSYSEFLRQEDICQGLVFKIADSVDGPSGILEAISVFVNFLLNPITNGLILDFSNIRPAGVINRRGLVASGAESFVRIFKGISKTLSSGSISDLVKLLGTINDVMRRGGYKKGIITSAMDWRCRLIREYLELPIVEVEGSHKKGVIIDHRVIESLELVELICKTRNLESTFIEKFHPDYPLLSANVCEGIYLGHRGSCLIWRVNLGKCEYPGNIVTAFANAALNLCELHTTWRKKTAPRSAIYAPIESDRQVGLDVMGLANYLGLRKITYREFGEALENFLRGKPVDEKAPAYELVIALNLGYSEAKRIADQYMLDRNLPLLERIFTIEPAQDHAYRTTDLEGYTICRGIFPPFGRIVSRVSDTQATNIYNHGMVETAGEVGSGLHKKICDLWQELMDRTGRAHAISQDSYESLTPELLQEFIDQRPSRTLYYAEAERFNQRKYLAKQVATVILPEKNDPIACGLREGECESCADG